MTRRLISGQSLFEVMVTMMIVSLVITAMAGMALLSVKASAYSRNKTLATRYLQQADEWLRGEKDSNWATFLAHTQSYSTVCLQNLGWYLAGQCGKIDDTAFTRQANFVPGGSSVQATVTVSWSDSGGTHESDSVTVFTNWQQQ